MNFQFRDMSLTPSMYTVLPFWFAYRSIDQLIPYNNC